MTRLHTVKEGSGPLLVLSHALGCDLTMWDGVAQLLAPQFTVLRYDHRGHGKSQVVPGPFSIADMARDAADLIASQGAGPVHFVGLSMGGMVAQQLAVLRPDLVRSLVVANSSSRYDQAARAMWRARVETVRAQGVAAIADGAMQRWFTPEFRADAQGAARVAALRAVLESTDAQAYAHACAAVAQIDFPEANRGIACPVLVIGGMRDEATPMAMSQEIRDAIAGAALEPIAAAHLSAVERPDAFAALVAAFAARH